MGRDRDKVRANPRIRACLISAKFYKMEYKYDKNLARTTICGRTHFTQYGSALAREMVFLFTPLYTRTDDG